MAYISSEEVKNIRNQLKAEFPYCKFSVVNRHSIEVDIAILSAPFNFNLDSPHISRNADGSIILPVNHYSLDRDDSGYYGDAEAYEFLRRVSAIAHSQDWYDDSDSQTDYFNTAYYVSISLGRWNKGFSKSERPKGLEPLVEAVDVEAVDVAVEAFLPEAVGQAVQSESLDPARLLTSEEYYRLQATVLGKPAQSLTQAESFLADLLLAEGKLIFYKALPEIVSAKAWRYWPVYDLETAKDAIGTGWILVDEEVREKYQKEAGYDLEEHFARLVRGEY
jgi:hypothetical protein